MNDLIIEYGKVNTMDEEESGFILDCVCECGKKHKVAVDQHWYLKFRDKQPVISICDECTKEMRKNK